MLYQLKSILWKNWLLKKAHLPGFLAEIFLPVLFMAILILIKSVTTSYDSPNVAFYCGNAKPWYYSSTLDTNQPFKYQIPLTCSQKPTTCDTSKYYQDKATVYPYQWDHSRNLSGYMQYGFTESAASSGVGTNPFYTYTIGDDAAVYYYGIDNPSYSCQQMVNYLPSYYPSYSVIAVAPMYASDPSLASQATQLMSYMKTVCGAGWHNSYMYFTSQSELDDYVTAKNYADADVVKVAYAIVLIQADPGTAQWEYAIRTNFTSVFEEGEKTSSGLYDGDFKYSIPSTKYYTQDLYKPQKMENIYGYTYSGFSTLQEVVDAFIFKTTTFTRRQEEIAAEIAAAEAEGATAEHLESKRRQLQSVEEYGVGLQGTDVVIDASVSLMPTAPYLTDDFQYVISSTLGIFYMLSFLYPVSRIVRGLVVEKETRIKEGMKMMGLTDTVYNLSWLITTFIQMTLVSILITAVTGSSVFQYSNKFYVFLYFEAFSLAVINMCFLMATFFSRAKAASLLGPMIFFASFFPFYAVNDPQFDEGSKTATCILAPACFALGASVFADYEGGLVGVQSENVGQTTSNFTYNACVGMLFFDAVLYGVLAWYLDKVFPSEYGTQLPLYFPFLPSYWCGVKVFEADSAKGVLGKKVKDSWFTRTLVALGVRPSGRRYSSMSNSGQEGAEAAADRLSLETGLIDETADSHHSSRNQYFEPVSAELRQQLTDEKCVSIRGLRKVFKNTAGGDDRIAVAGLNLDLYQGQVTVLLGHNGAGKTTTISMLVGLIPPSAGDAALPGGLTITEDMQAIRRNLGVCPQHDILFPELTAMQHLQIYAAFKGVASSNVDAEAKRMLSEVGLTEKAHARSSTLSGGQKRKLSLGIALIGDSKVVILDEPTSGMDPYSRRSTWNIIQRNKKGRVILLTTHFMDEADLLGDRVAIMAHGKLQCVGNPLFLKSKFGVGYTLTVVKTAQTHQGKAELAAISARITDLVQQHVPSGELLSDVGAEQSFRLPFSASDRFVGLFKALDSSQAALNIAEYGISVTTLEEVFIRVGELENVEEGDEGQQQLVAPESVIAVDALNIAAGANGAHVMSPVSGGDRSPNRVLNDDAGMDESLHSGMQNVSLIGGPVVDGKGGKVAPIPEKEEKYYTTDHDISTGPVFWKHFRALFTKRAIYGKRDRRMLCCQLALPVFLLIVGLTILLIAPDFNQPDLVLSSDKYNTGKASIDRNYVAFNVNPTNTIGTAMKARFNGNAADGVAGVAVDVPASAQVDEFYGCSLGADPLHTTSNFMLEAIPETEHGSSRYGAVTIADGTSTTLLQYNVMVNGSANHGVGIYVNEVHTAYLQVLSRRDKARITIHNHPLPRTYQQDQQMATTSAFIVSLFAMIAFCFIPASFAVFVVKEREVKAKHQQIISGVSIYAYWCSTYLWDILSYIPTAMLVVALLYCYDIPAYTTGPAGTATILLFLLNGPATAAFTYLISYLFSSHSTAQIIVMFFNFLTGLCLMVVSFVLTTVPSTSELNLSLRYMFRLFPSFCLGDGLAQLALCSDGTTCPTISATGYDFESTQSPLSWDITGANLVFLGVHAIAYFILVLIVEYSLTFPSLLAWLHRVHDNGYVPDGTEDVDVTEERNRVMRGGADKDVVRIEALRKLYPISNKGWFSWFCGAKQEPQTKTAVQSLCFGIPRGECFGFLGINGAGKTTTLSILSGEFPPTSGRAFIDGFNIQEDQSNIRRRIGYCPQFDALLELLTVREHLQLYGRIKGLTGDALEAVVCGKMRQLDLLDFEHKTAGSLSGGNKRKLSVAVATIGDPSILFLDEPSTGMDPVARRFMWEVIAKMSTQGGKCSVILTTHSMEEAEALCTRIGVMVNGRLCCLGSGQHLKQRFGNGFEVNIRTTMSAPEAILALAQKLSTHHAIQPLPGSESPIVSFLVRSNSQRGEAEDGQGLDHLETIMLKPADVHNACLALSNAPREKDIAPFQSGALLHEMLETDGVVSLKAFLEWWVAEDVAEALRQFMAQEFDGRAALLERSTSHNFRYRVRLAEAATVTAAAMESEGSSSSPAPQDTQSALSEVFEKFEGSKARLGIQEYSVGQTTLEQIFNQFAAQQDNPEVAAILASNAANGRTSSRSSLTHRPADYK